MLTMSDLSSALPFWDRLAKPGIGAFVGPCISMSDMSREPGARLVGTGALFVLEGSVPAEAVAEPEDAIPGKNLWSRALSRKCLIAQL
jgi:hypothetical protein